VAIGVGDESPCEAEDSGVAFEMSLGKFRQVPVEAGVQIALDLTELLFHDVEVVDDPFRRGRDRALLVESTSDRAISGEQYASVLCYPWRDAGPSAPGRDAVRSREAPRMLFQSLGPEKFRANRLFGFEKQFFRREVSEPGKPVAPRLPGKARYEPARLAIDRKLKAHQEGRASDSY
jgi:hypothetical protein